MAKLVLELSASNAVTTRTASTTARTVSTTTLRANQGNQGVRPLSLDWLFHRQVSLLALNVCPVRAMGPDPFPEKGVRPPSQRVVEDALTRDGPVLADRSREVAVGTMRVMQRRPSRATRGSPAEPTKRQSLIVTWAIGFVLLLSACASDSAATTSGAEGDSAEGQPPTDLAVDDDATVTSSSSGADESATPTTTTSRSSTSTSSTASTTTAAPTTTSTTIPTVPLETIELELELISTFTSPVGVVTNPTTDDLYVVEQGGRVVRLPSGRAEGADVTLDLRGSVSLGNEQGLLGLAFSADGHRLYVDYTDTSGTTVIARYEMDGLIADAQSGETLLTIPQPRGNHNGGQLALGPDGFLYIGLGDGGGGGDPDSNGQNPDTLLGSILRIDVSASSGYDIPADNPFVDGGAPEVFIWGIRNAWRFGFDSATGDLWIGDVGQDRFEEVTVLRASEGGGNGANLGWNEAEGTEPYRSGTIPEDHVAPVITYAHVGGRCSITGGEVYRGSAIPPLAGTYLYGDFCSGEVFGYRVDGSADPTLLDLSAVSRLSSFGVDSNDEILAVSRSGGLYRIIAR